MIGWCVVVGSLSVAGSEAHLDGLLILIFTMGAIAVGMALDSKLWESHAIAGSVGPGKLV
jgi:hypothetical protein